MKCSSKTQFFKGKFEHEGLQGTLVPSGPMPKEPTIDELNDLTGVCLADRSFATSQMDEEFINGIFYEPTLMIFCR